MPFDFKNSVFITCALLIIIGVAALFRIPFLSVNPPGLYCDEAVCGYDAYSILKTGRDHHGDFLPLFRQSFGEYPPATYAYAAIPSIAIFGLNEFAVRLPAAILGILTVLATFFLVRSLINAQVALTCSFFLAISPWHIHFSRIGFDVILLPFFITTAILFFIKALAARQPQYLLLSSLFFALGLHSHFAGRVLAPLFVVILFVLYMPFLIRNYKYTIISSILFLLALSCLMPFWLSSQGMARITNQGGIHWDIARILNDYLNYFKPAFLFLKGDFISRHHIQGSGGQLYWWQLIAVPIGILWILLNQKKMPLLRILIAWLLLYPIPGFIISSQPHAGRSILGSVIFAILSGIGIYFLVHFIKNFLLKRCVLLVLIILIIISTFNYIKQYYLIYPKISALSWTYGLKDFFKMSESIPGPIVVSPSFEQPYIFKLFYSKQNPSLSLQNKQRTLNIDRYFFMPAKYCPLKPFFYVFPPNELNDFKNSGLHYLPFKTINLPDGSPAVFIVLIPD